MKIVNFKIEWYEMPGEERERNRGGNGSSTPKTTNHIAKLQKNIVTFAEH